MSEENTCNSSCGQIQIADEVLAIIAATAATEVEGVRTVSQATSESIVEFFGKKNQSKGVKVSFDGEDACVDIEIAMVYGTKINHTALEVQKRIKNAIETMTGIKISAVNVSVSAVVTEIVKAENTEE